MKKLVCESLNEYVSKAEDKWADRQIKNWELEQDRVDPLSQYVTEVIDIILSRIPQEVIEEVGIDKILIDDIISSSEDIEDMDKNVFDYWGDGASPWTAADQLEKTILKFIEEYGSM